MGLIVGPQWTVEFIAGRLQANAEMYTTVSNNSEHVSKARKGIIY